MTTPISTPIAPKPPRPAKPALIVNGDEGSRDIAQMVADISAHLGEQKMAQLHRSNTLADALAVITVIAAPYLVVWGLFNSSSLLLSVALSMVMGLLIVLGGLVAHEIGIHRRAFRPNINKFISALLFLPTTQRATWYELKHRIHHRHFNTELDSEQYKKQLNGWGRRLAFSTILGFIVLKLPNKNAPAAADKGFHETRMIISKRDARWLKLERVMQVVLACAVIALCLSNFYVALYAIVLPVVFWAPMVNTLRVVGDHAAIDPKNPWWLASCYPANWINGPFFFFDSGEYHQVHHVFPKIPYYRMTDAVKAMRPLFHEKGIIEKRSLTQLTWTWFTGKYAHGNAWK